MNIEVPGLTLTINVNERTVEGEGGPYLDWLYCTVLIDVPGFTGNIRCQVTHTELERLARELELMNKQLAPGMVARLYNIKPGIDIRFELGIRGEITGEYIFINPNVEPFSPVLKGPFSMDQTYLTGVYS